MGKLYALWVDFAKFYEKNKQINDARIIFEKATHVAYLKVDDLANVWCEWVEMELRSTFFFLDESRLTLTIYKVTVEQDSWPVIISFYGRAPYSHWLFSK